MKTQTEVSNIMTKECNDTEGAWCLVRIVDGVNAGPLTLTEACSHTSLGYVRGSIVIGFVRLNTKEEAEKWANEDHVYTSAHTEAFPVCDLLLDITLYEWGNASKTKTLFRGLFSDKFESSYYEALALCNGAHRTSKCGNSDWRMKVTCFNSEESQQAGQCS